jgi:predicted nucleic-acid-binding protein
LKKVSTQIGMVSVDTNVVVRLLTNDDPDQFRQSYKIFANEQVFIPDTVILETEWVLRYAYKFEAEQISGAFSKLFGLPNSHLRSANDLALALEWYDKGLEFADALHLSQSQHCRRMLTFDRRFAARSSQIDSTPVRLIGS